MRHLRSISHVPMMAVDEEPTGPSITQILTAIKSIFDAMIQIVTAMGVFGQKQAE